MRSFGFRRDWLKKKIEGWDKNGSRRGLGYLYDELAAIEWVFGLVQEVDDDPG